MHKGLCPPEWVKAAKKYKWKKAAPCIFEIDKTVKIKSKFYRNFVEINIWFDLF